MQVEVDKNGEKFKLSLNIMKQFIDNVDKNIAFVPDPTGTAQIIAASKVIASSKQAQDLQETISDIRSLSEEYSSSKNELKDLLEDNYDIFKLNGDNSSYREAMKKTFEEGLIKVNGNWISGKKWWTDGWDDYFNGVKDGVSSILEELNPFKDLSTAEWKLMLLAYKRIINEKYENYNKKIKNARNKYFLGFHEDDVFNIREAFGGEYAGTYGNDNGYNGYGPLHYYWLSQLDKLKNLKKKPLKKNTSPSISKVKKDIKNIEVESKYKVLHEFEKYNEKLKFGTEFDKILASGSDFIPNHYDAAFYWNSSSNAFDEFVRIKNSETKQDKAFLSPAGFAVRMTGITIPQLKNKTFEINGVSHGIKKLSSMHDISKKTSFNFRIDSQVAWLKLFGQLIGENNFFEGEIRDKEKFVTVFANSFSSGNINDSHLCLAIKLGNLTQFNKMYYRVIVFEDVKITGTDNLKFSTDGGISEMGIEFIYRKSKIYRVGEEDRNLGLLKDGGYFEEHRTIQKLWN